MTDFYDDYGGGRYRPSDPYESCIDDVCPRCHAEAGSRCRNPLTGKPSHAPCIVRSKPSRVVA